MSVITLHNMKFHAYHGCLDFEKEEGNTFLVSVIMELNTTLAGKTDDLDDTLNYQQVYDVAHDFVSGLNSNVRDRNGAPPRLFTLAMRSN